MQNNSMLEDERLSEKDFFDKYFTIPNENPNMYPKCPASAWIGHIMTKLVEEWVYKIDEVLKKEYSLYNDDKVNKVIYDLYEILEGTGLRDNFSTIFTNAKLKDFFSYETSTNFVEWIFKILKEKFKNWEIKYDTWINIMKEFKNYDWNNLVEKLVENKNKKNIS